MRKTFKRSLALVLSLLMLLTVTPISFAAKTCENCNQKVEPVDTVACAATCSTYGYSKDGQYCPNCGKCFTDDEGRRIDKTPHDALNLDSVPAVLPTCETNGTIEH